ncbi:MAG: hypothetical protein AB7V08_14295 [Elusimicrobiales bacterium]
MTQRDTTSPILAMARMEAVAYFAPGAWLPLSLAGPGTILETAMPDAVCAGCAMAALPPGVRRALLCLHAAGSLCARPYMQEGRIAIAGLTRYRRRARRQS